MYLNFLVGGGGDGLNVHTLRRGGTSKTYESIEGGGGSKIH